MAHFASYNTSDPTTGATPLGNGNSITPIVIQAQQYGALTYSCYSDVAGTLYIAQSFDGTNFDFQQEPTPGTPGIPVPGGAVLGNGIFPGIGGTVDIVAPFVQVQFTCNAANQNVLRLFVRCFGTKT